jgi:hypothetical protein
MSALIFDAIQHDSSPPTGLDAQSFNTEQTPSITSSWRDETVCLSGFHAPGVPQLIHQNLGGLLQLEGIKVQP